MKPGIVSVLLVMLQLGGLAAVVFTGPVIATSLPWLLLQGAGLVLGFWAVLAMRPKNLSITPEPRSGARLVCRGPYRVLRHPMYTSLMMVVGALLADDWSISRCGTALLLTFVLVLKMHREESFLRATYPTYTQYAESTWRLVPLLY